MTEAVCLHSRSAWRRKFALVLHMFRQALAWQKLPPHGYQSQLLKLLINLALKQLEAAQDLVGAFLQYNDNTVERKLFCQALNVALEVALDPDLDMANYAYNFRRMFDNARLDAVIGSLDGSVRFYGLSPASTKLEGLDRHHRLIDSLQK
jgi:ribosomal protein S12 methylthiotransferase accessory factor